MPRCSGRCNLHHAVDEAGQLRGLDDRHSWYATDVNGLHRRACVSISPFFLQGSRRPADMAGRLFFVCRQAAVSNLTTLFLALVHSIDQLPGGGRNYARQRSPRRAHRGTASGHVGDVGVHDGIAKIPWSCVGERRALSASANTKILSDTGRGGFYIHIANSNVSEGDLAICDTG